MDIPWRSTVLFIVAVAGILFAVATRSLVVLQGLTMIAFAILGVLAVVLVRRGARSIPSDPRLARAAARAGRFEQCGLYLQVANERLRFQVHAALAEELLSLRTPSYEQR